MTGLLGIVILGSLILIFGLRLVLQSPNTSAQSPSVTLEEFADAREALDTAFVEAAAIERIFSTEDMAFISHASSPKARQLFLEERKALAIQWLRKTQKQVAQLMDLHLRLAGHLPSSVLVMAARSIQTQAVCCLHLARGRILLHGLQPPP